MQVPNFGGHPFTPKPSVQTPRFGGIGYNAPRFGGTYEVQRYTRDGREVQDRNFQNHMLTGYLKEHSGFQDIRAYERNGMPFRPNSVFTGYWRGNELEDDAVLLTNDDQGDHFDRAQKILETHANDISDVYDDWAVQELNIDMLRTMLELTHGAVPVEIQETTGPDGEPTYRFKRINPEDYRDPFG